VTNESHKEMMAETAVVTDESGPHILKVGGLMPNGQTRYPEGAHYDYNRAGHWLIGSYSAPSSGEIKAFRHGEIQWAVKSYPGFTAVYFRPSPMPWQEAFFEIGRVTDQEWVKRLESGAAPTDPVQRRDGVWEVELINLVLLDASTGVIKALRVVGPPRLFMRHLAESIRAQIKGPRFPRELTTAWIFDLQQSGNPDQLGRAAFAEMK